MNDLSVRIRAVHLRKKFEGHSGIVREIVSSLTDAELVHKYDQFEANRLHHMRKSAPKPKTKAEKIYSKCLRQDAVASV